MKLLSILPCTYTSSFPVFVLGLYFRQAFQVFLSFGLPSHFCLIAALLIFPFVLKSILAPQSTRESDVYFITC